MAGRLRETELLARVRRCLYEELALFAGTTGRLMRWPGVIAAVQPATPDRSLFNAVALEPGATASALEAVYDQVRRTYAAAGVRAFTVWVEPGDATTAAVLASLGHHLDSSPAAMAGMLAEVATPLVGDLDWRESRDGQLVGRINDAAYGFPPPAFGEVLAELPDRWHAYIARLGGTDVGALLCHESEDGDCGVSAVATLPAAQGEGIATRLLTVALDAARRRGAITTTLQASTRGKPVYTRLGYRDLGNYQMWERREPR
jgi:GNAT superfamily N-acetyltransferase